MSGGHQCRTQFEINGNQFLALCIAVSGLPRLRAHWVRPEVVVDVAFLEWTVHGKLRHARLLRLRFDKSAREVQREAR
jgi:ATP-dependent DNA ligase